MAILVPAEISLAHRGVLFLDELPEFDRKVPEVLREPLESGHMVFQERRDKQNFRTFSIDRAMNPCPCGYFGHFNGKCRCTPDAIARYQGRLSGPLLDRIDMQIPVNALWFHSDLVKLADGEHSIDIRARSSAPFNGNSSDKVKANNLYRRVKSIVIVRLNKLQIELLQKAMTKVQLVCTRLSPRT